MELERRTINLQQWVDLLEGDIARERKAKDGIQHLAQVCGPCLYHPSIHPSNLYSILIPVISSLTLRFMASMLLERMERVEMRNIDALGVCL